MRYKDGLKQILNETALSTTAFGASPGIGQHGGAVGNDDFYARGDARNVLGFTELKKGKRKRNKKFLLYRRSFKEALTTEDPDDLILSCVLECDDETMLVAEELIKQTDLPYVMIEGCIHTAGTDEDLNEYLDGVSQTVGESNFEERCMAFICEGKSIYDSFRKPKKEITEYDQKQLTAGANVEMEHTTDMKIAYIIAANHLDEDPDYYIKLKKMEAG